MNLHSEIKLKLSLLLLFLLILLQSKEICSAKRLKVYFPGTWLKARNNFGIPFSVQYISLSQMNDWTSDWPNEKSWQYLHMANYEPPLYIKEGYWIPNSFKTICTPEAEHKSFTDMVYEFTQEDYEKRYTTSLRNLFTRTAKHYDGGYLNILSFFVNICQCLRKNDTHLYCPNPCRKPDVCDVSINSNGLCLILPSTEPLKVIPSNIRSVLGSAYAYDYECVCIDGYVFNNTLKKCIPIEKQCDSSVCFNDGICEYIPEDQRIIQEIQFSCKCPPAWKGLSCSEPRNPCLETQGLCGQHYCYRDPSNVKVGYRCACPPGFKPLSSTQPQCVNMNECVEYPDEACLNGGRCIDKDPSSSAIGIDMTEENLGYTCQCRHGYSGSRCERRAPPLEWTTWSAWTTCSVKCGLGIHKRFRTCPLPNRCIGSYIQTSRCQGPIAYCQDEYDEEMPELTQSGSKILKSWGIGWHLGDDHTLNDAFYWNEAEEGWDSLHYRFLGVFILGDILEWTYSLQLSHKWTIKELLVFHSILLALLFVPLCLIIFSLAKMIQRILYEYKTKRSLE